MSTQELGEMLVRYKADISDLTKNVKQAKSDISSVGETAKEAQEKTSGGFAGMLKSAVSFAAGMAVFNLASDAIGAVKSQLTDLFQLTMQHQDVMNSTANVLKHMGNASGQTEQSLSDFADAMSKTTRFSADATQQGENVMLTFGNIGKTVFPQATLAAMNMSSFLGQDLQSSVIQVGKALNDPLQGLTALSRVGVSFTQQEKDSIKTMMAHNDVIGAQKIVMFELNKQFGGDAVTAGKSFAGQLDILKNQAEDFKIKIGTALLPALTGFLGFITGSVLPGLGKFKDAVTTFLAPVVPLFQFIGYTAKNAFGDLRDTLTQVGQIFKSVFGGIGGGGGDNPLTMFLSNLIGQAYPIIQNLGQAFHDFMINLQKNLSTINPQDILNFFRQIGNAFTNFMNFVRPVFQQISGIVGGQVKQDFATFMGVVKELAGWWQSTMMPAIKQALPGFESLGKTIFTQILPALAQLWADGHKIADALLPVIIKAFETFAPIVMKVAGFISGLLSQAIKFLLPYVIQAAGEVVKFAQDIATRVMPIIQQLGKNISAIADWLMTNWPKIWGILAPIVMDTFNTIKGVIQIAWSLISGIFKIALDVISGNWGQAWNDMKDMFHGIWDGIVSIAKGAINLIIGFINDMIGGFDSIGIDVGPVHIHPNIPKIPLLASGGFIQSSGLAFVHAGEAVVPRAQTTPLGSSGVGGGQTFILEVDSVQLAQIINKSSDRLVRLKLGSAGRAA